MLYAAKCYWPGVTQADLEQVAERAARAGPAADSDGVAYLGALLFAADDLVLCLFQGRSRAAVIRASDRLGIPHERLMDSLWLGPGRRIRQEAQQCPTADGSNVQQVTNSPTFDHQPDWDPNPTTG